MNIRESIAGHIRCNPWEMLIYVSACLAIIIALTLMLIPKQHQGYYIFSGNAGDIPTFRVVNNWAYWPDSYLYTSHDIDKTIAVYDKLTKENK